ncbi:MAG: aspartate carbamoyltransferase regulatory subunit [Bacteroidales bacterium]|nr:aspartate carbamoyltransferase regulatory subunit [Bacteroidales bacterium]
MADKSEMQVKALKNGTVIDHIPSDKLFKVVSILKLDKIDSEVTIGNNLSSRLMGRKGIIKIADRYFEEDEINRIALIAPKAKINTIRDYEVVEKKVIELPEEISGLVRCVNPKCITNNEPMEPCYRVVGRSPLTLKCRYCEHTMSQEEIKLL